MMVIFEASEEVSSDILHFVVHFILREEEEVNSQGKRYCTTFTFFLKLDIHSSFDLVKIFNILTPSLVNMASRDLKGAKVS